MVFAALATAAVAAPTAIAASTTAIIIGNILSSIFLICFLWGSLDLTRLPIIGYHLFLSIASVIATINVPTVTMTFPIAL